MRIYIADIKSFCHDDRSTGHYMPVARNYQEIFQNRAEVRIAGGPVYKRYFYSDKLLVLPYNVISDSPISKLYTFANAIFLFWKARGSVIVLQQSTSVTSFVAITLFYWWTSKLFLIQYNTEALNSWLKRGLYYMAHYKINGFICPNEHVGKAFGRPFCIVPDYIYTEKKMPMMKSYEHREYDFSIIGSIHRDKGVIEAAQKLKEQPYKVLIAGKAATSELQRELEEIVAGCENITLRLEYISDKKYVEYIQNSKYSLLNYSGTYLDRSSGVVLDIIHHGTPVVGHRCIALKLVEEYSMGYLYNDISDVDLDTILKKENFECYCKNLTKYLNDQKRVVDKLEAFLKKQ